MKRRLRERIARVHAMAIAFWCERNARERMLLLYAAGVIVLGVVYGTLVDPALSGRAGLQKNLPALRQQAAQLQVLSAEALTLAASATPPVVEVSQSGIEEALTRSGLKAGNVGVDDGLVRLRFASVSFAALSAWIEQVQREARLTVADASFSAQGAPDVVNATLTLKQQRANE